MTAIDPDGYAVEFAQGKRGENQTTDAEWGKLTERAEPPVSPGDPELARVFRPLSCQPSARATQ